ncbi:hypothetical protein BGZ61DRAFT_447788 [Ilyonectria robusta]|uniref:uncharacterized protein n=1 Tax=Ilyonectria robusta TaxID=1079257 RepID=UPI001E8E10C5|nr:uncharacterized protein BGZ61DRAFT_447788 [Ilyonectria robusta]KAH8721995.1 hypothetical protein BGZ61DRAFT_447788 [Ilyonectria robusta]
MYAFFLTLRLGLEVRGSYLHHTVLSAPRTIVPVKTLARTHAQSTETRPRSRIDNARKRKKKIDMVHPAADGTCMHSSSRSRSTCLRSHEFTLFASQDKTVLVVRRDTCTRSHKHAARQRQESVLGPNLQG